MEGQRISERTGATGIKRVSCFLTGSYPREGNPDLYSSSNEEEVSCRLLSPRLSNVDYRGEGTVHGGRQKEDASGKGTVSQSTNPDDLRKSKELSEKG